jgi:catechol 2,3-dioxygenase-like lactoylglutathione lyase family enzyme
MIDGSMYHLGIVVRDIDAAMEHYRTVLGLGPFARLDTSYPARFRDWRGTIENRNAFAKWGDIYLELVEPGPAPGVARQWLETRGEGVFHVGYSTADVRQRPGNTEVCFEVLNIQTASGDVGIVYLDTVEALGYYVELVDAPRAEGIVQRIAAAGGR